MFLELPPSVIKYLVLLLGALSVVVHSKRQYEISSYPLDGSYAEVLSSASTSALAGTNTFGRGRFFYICIFLGIYIILCSSTLLLNLAASVAENYNIDVVGIEISSKQADTNINSFDYAIPLTVSTLIITFTSIPPFSEIEKMVRNLAHSASGIPRNIYDAIDKIIRFDFTNWNGETSHTVREAQELGEAVTNAAKSANISETAAIAMGKSVTKIEALVPLLDGQMVLFSERSRAELTPMLNSVISSSKMLLSEIHDYLEDKNTNEAAWEAISYSISRTERNVAAVFGLLVINNRGRRPNEKAPAISSMLEEIENSGNNKPLNSVIGALIWGASVSIFFVILFRVSSYIIRQNIQSGQEPKSIGHAMIPDNLNSFIDAIIFGLRVGVFDVLLNATLFAVSVLTALSLRATKLEHRSWTPYSFRGRHYVQYFTVTLISTIVVVVPIYMLIQALSASGDQLLYIDDSFRKAADIIRTKQYWASFIGFLLAIPVIWCSLNLCDIIDEDPDNLTKLRYGKILLFILIFAIIASIPSISNLDEKMTTFEFISILFVEILIPFACFSAFMVMLGITLKRQKS